MDWFIKKTDDAHEPAPEPPKAAEPFNPPFVKTEAYCVVDGCHELKQPGQTYFCAKHVRAG